MFLNNIGPIVSLEIFGMSGKGCFLKDPWKLSKVIKCKDEVFIRFEDSLAWYLLDFSFEKSDEDVLNYLGKLINVAIIYIVEGGKNIIILAFLDETKTKRIGFSVSGSFS